jgi:hypothetical protein
LDVNDVEFKQRQLIEDVVGPRPSLWTHQLRDNLSVRGFLVCIEAGSVHVGELGWMSVSTT